MIDRIPGHGTDRQTNISYAQHLDYEKWNSHQKHGSTFPIFGVSDRAFEYKRLISMIHEFFQDSWIYYSKRGDLLNIIYGELRKLTDLVCWNGQGG